MIHLPHEEQYGTRYAGYYLLYTLPLKRRQRPGRGC